MIKSCVLLLLLTVCGAHCSVALTCTHKNISSAYLDIAIEMITRAKINIAIDSDCTKCPKDCPECPKDCPECPTVECPDCPKCPECPKLRAVDCADLRNLGHNKSGIYVIWPANRLTDGRNLTVYCDMDTVGGGWTVIQRRGDFGSPKDYFYKDWKSYKQGFGRKEKDFWLGNDNIFALTNQKPYSVRFDLMDVEKNTSYALYDKFFIDDERNNYTLYISDYSGTAGDSMAFHNNQAFTTKDRDNDSYPPGNCAVNHKGAWWYNACRKSNLNGLYHKGKHEYPADGINWESWKGAFESLLWTEIKIRPKNFKAPKV